MKTSYRPPEPGDPNWIDPEKTRSIQLAGRRASGERGKAGSDFVHNPSWEAGKALDHRGVPYLDPSSGKPIPIKQFTEQKNVNGGYADRIKKIQSGGLLRD